MNKRKDAWINFIFILITLIVNGLGATGFFNGLSQKEISDRYLTLITPSPSTFSIWSLIYLLLIVSLIIMIIKSKDSYYKKVIDKISNLFRLSCALNILWIIAFSYLQLAISSIFILSFVFVLSKISLILRKMDSDNRILIPLTFGMYTGWVFIATVVNISATLVKFNFSGFGIGQEILAVVTLLISVILVYLVNKSNKNVVFPLPIAWAYFGIYQFLNSPKGFNGQYSLLSNIAIFGMIVLISLSIFRFYKNKYSIV